MINEEFVSMYKEGTKEFFDLWTSDKQNPELASEFLRNASLLRRYSGNEDVIKLLIDFPKEERKILGLQAAKQLSKRWIKKATEEILKEEDLDYIDMEQIESILLYRDEMQETLHFIRRIVRDFLKDKDLETIDIIGRAACSIAEADDLFKDNKDTTGFASWIFEDLLPYCVITPNKDSWWFYKAQQWRKEAILEIQKPLSHLFDQK